jgi:GNAT superfamily N-acetyltransferase
VVEILVVPWGSDFYYQALALRNLYLRQPLGLSFTEDDRWEDQSACHVVAVEADRVIGCGLGVPKEEGIKIRQMIVHPDFQRQGIGGLVLRTIEQTFIDRGQFYFFLHARMESLGFYLQNNYKPIGLTFYEVGILHQKMEKQIKPSKLPLTEVRGFQ